MILTVETGLASVTVGDKVAYFGRDGLTPGTITKIVNTVHLGRTAPAVDTRVYLNRDVPGRGTVIIRNPKRLVKVIEPEVPKVISTIIDNDGDEWNLVHGTNLFCCSWDTTWCETYEYINNSYGIREEY